MSAVHVQYLEMHREICIPLITGNRLLRLSPLSHSPPLWVSERHDDRHDPTVAQKTKTESPLERPRGQFDGSLYPGKRAENREVEANRDMIDQEHHVRFSAHGDDIISLRGGLGGWV